jgi:hypothetical protein
VGLDADRDQHRLHQATTATIVIRIGCQPKRQSEQTKDPGKDQKLDHGVPMTANKLAVLASSCVAKEAVTPTCWGKALAKALAGILGHAGLQLFAKFGVIKVFADQYDLVLAFGAGPFGIVDDVGIAALCVAILMSSAEQWIDRGSPVSGTAPTPQAGQAGDVIAVIGRDDHVLQRLRRDLLDGLGVWVSRIRHQAVVHDEGP